MKIRKRHLTLLEVLISLLLLTAVLPILVSTYMFTYAQQEKYLNEVSIDRMSNSVFVALFDDIFNNRIPYRDLESGRDVSLNPKYLPEDLKGWQGTYSFKMMAPKTKKAEGNYFVELWRVTFQFSYHDEKNKREFPYDFVVIRDLSTPEPLPKGNEGGQKPQEPNKPQDGGNGAQN